MNTTGNATFSTKSWDEKPYTEIDPSRKLTRVHAVFVYAGDIAGESAVEYLMAYNPDGTGSFVGLERIVGSVCGRAGSFVVQHTGTFDPQSVTTHWDFVPGSGTDALAGILGHGELKLIGHGPYPFAFIYEFK